MDLALNNLQRLICHKTQTSDQPTNHLFSVLSFSAGWYKVFSLGFYNTFFKKKLLLSDIAKLQIYLL